MHMCVCTCVCVYICVRHTPCMGCWERDGPSLDQSLSSSLNLSRGRDSTKWRERMAWTTCVTLDKFPASFMLICCEEVLNSQSSSSESPNPEKDSRDYFSIFPSMGHNRYHSRCIESVTDSGHHRVLGLNSLWNLTEKVLDGL